jgi:N-carbamoyl-L-amino-acid hydrolase
MEDVRINPDRLWASLMEMAKIGGTPAGGVCRLTLTNLARESRDLFIAWCEEAGCATHFDAAGNIFARRAGADDTRAPVMTGSHLDTQPTGGRFDGAYGVIAGLEVVRTLNEHGIETAAPVEVAVWTNEEGCRFTPSMAGSGAFAGVYDLDYILARTDESGVSIGAELTRIGYAGDVRPGAQPVAAYFEAHIEQGPVLEAENTIIGVVTGGQGKRSYEVTVSGQEAHAGTTPMAVRRDALQGAVRMIAEADRIALDNAPQAVATVGMVSTKPNSRNTIPGTAFFSADMRHPDRRVLDAMDAEFRRACEDIAQASGLGADIVEVSRYQPVAFDETCIAAVRAAAGRLGYSHRDIVSGAGHDACYLARVAPTGMIFIPCENGISHAEIENATPADTAAGCNVLLHAMLEFAGRH